MPRLNADFGFPVLVDLRTVDRSARTFDDSTLRHFDKLSRGHVRSDFRRAGCVVPNRELENFHLAHRLAPSTVIALYARLARNGKIKGSIRFEFSFEPLRGGSTVKCWQR
jgi:hypothetical protein